MSTEKLIENAKIAQKIWVDLKDNELKTKFKKNFHVRPTDKGITLVSTYSSKPMNGNKKVRIRTKRSTGKAKYFEEDFIRKCANLKFDKKDWEDIGIMGTNTKTELKLQAWLINVINNCDNKYDKELGEFKKALEKALKIEVKKIYFIGSELILQEDDTNEGQKPDIVIHDGNGTIYFLELKTSIGYSREDGKTPHEQVQEYVNKYGNDGQYKELLLNYPMVENLKKINEWRGVVVKGDKNTREICYDKDEDIIRIPE